MDRGATLRSFGVVVIPVFSDDNSRAKWSRRCGELWTSSQSTSPSKDTQRVLGGFGALGNPSSFHHPYQELRYFIKKHVSRPLFRKYSGGKQVNLEMLFDRLCVRKKSFGNVGAEQWHRDIYDGAKYGLRDLPKTLPGPNGLRRDEIFGGWVNLSDNSQEFVGLIGTHKGSEAKRAQRAGGGFATIDDKDKKLIGALNEQLRSQANTAYSNHLATNAAGHIIVPPGHMVVFLQRILHSVLSTTPAEPSLRLFVGHR